MWKWIFRLKALLKGWIRVNARAWAVLRKNLAYSQGMKSFGYVPGVGEASFGSPR